ncbi:hypothetical protein GPJ56_005631 [Histomonas meleagridis]|uniref:uncharacterized protein n=1 Tax=Histomonas meleagridis TaxID=135588 RepID=UPI003559A1E3|nr:hypothetical protein GPJ56_005631 [Histomonas meleagridis]KAH0803434.1 hypothetical protein GO595_003778 [Histomonas meleagridis]
MSEANDSPPAAENSTTQEPQKTPAQTQNSARYSQLMNAVKNLPQGSGGTKWVLPGESTTKAAPKSNAAANKSFAPTPSQPAAIAAKQAPTAKPADPPAPPAPKPVSPPPAAQKPVSTSAAKPIAAPASPKPAASPATTAPKPAAAPAASPKPAVTSQKANFGAQRTQMKAHEPEPEFKQKLEQLHSTPNRPGVLAQHDFIPREQPVVHASYTTLKRCTTWTGPTPETFDEKVDWLEQTGEFHTYEYKTIPTQIPQPPSGGSSFQRARSMYEGKPSSPPSPNIQRESTGQMSSLISRYNNRGMNEEEPKRKEPIQLPQKQAQKEPEHEPETEPEQIPEEEQVEEVLIDMQVQEPEQEEQKVNEEEDKQEEVDE